MQLYLAQTTIADQKLPAGLIVVQTVISLDAASYLVFLRLQISRDFATISRIGSLEDSKGTNRHGKMDYNLIAPSSKMFQHGF